MDESDVTASIASSQGGVARLDQLRVHGVPYAHLRRRSPDVGARIFRGVYRVGPAATSDGEADRAALWAAHLQLGPESTAVLRSALRLHGIEGAMGPTIPELAMPPGLEKHQRSGMAIHFWRLVPDQVTVVDRMPTTSVRRTLADAARLLTRMQAVACIDSALFQGLVTPADLDIIAASMSRQRSCVGGRRNLREASLGAQSPLETRVRLRACDGGFPPDALQVPIRDRSGELLGFGDMGYELAPGQWLIVEADGRQYHELPEAHLHDRRRQNAFLAQNDSRIVRFTWEDTRLPTYIPSVIRPKLTRGGWRPLRP